MPFTEIIKRYIPNLTKAEQQESVGGFHLFKIYRNSNTKDYQYVCLYEIDDYTPDPLELTGEMSGIEDSFGLPVEGCFVVGSARVVNIEQLESNPTLRQRRDFYFYDQAGQPYSESGQGYLLYLLMWRG